MLQKICDNCKTSMVMNEYYDENTFGLIINTESGKELSFSGDLCEECEKKIIQEITALLHSYNINEDKVEEITEEEEEIKLIEVKEETEEE